MRQIARRFVLAAALASASVVACEDSEDTTTDNDNVGGSGRDGGTTNRDGGSSSTGGGTGGNSTGGTGGGSAGGGDAGEEESDGGVSSNVDGGTSAGDGGASANDAGNGDGGDAGQVDLTDPQIGAVTTAANNGEVAQANAALPKLTDADAKAFAQEMITAHSAAQTRQAALLQSKGITPAENTVSTELKQESDAIVAQLMAAMEDVDRVYIQAQVDVHTKVLETLEDVLIPSAEDPDLERELKATRDDVQTHLDHAQEILDALGG